MALCLGKGGNFQVMVFRNLYDGAHAFPFDIDKVILTKPCGTVWRICQLINVL